MRKQQYGMLLSAAAVTLWLGLAGCAGRDTTVADKVTADQLDKSFAMLEERVEDGRKVAMPVLAPESFKAARDKIATARQMRTAGRSNEDIQKVLDEAAQSLNKAETTVQVAKAVMPEVIEARDKAIEAGMPRAKPEAYRSAESQLVEVSQALERGNLSVAQNQRRNLVNRFQTVEADTLKSQTLSDARANIQRARRLGASRLTPTLLKRAEDSMRVAERRIENRLDIDETTQQAVQRAVFDSKRLLNLTEWAKFSREHNPEAVALQVESLLKRVSDQVGAGELRDHHFETQVQSLVSSIDTLKQSARAQLSEAEAQTASLIGDAESARVFRALAGKFDEEEAEVIRSGDAIAIRLKSLAFPVGKATLSEKDFTLLGKVTEALQGLKGIEVTVQGHADSTGNEEFNRRLSEKRAETVRQYLISSKVVPAKHVKVDAMGSAQPVRTNETSRGRAQNRRVDILIRSVGERPTMAE